MAQVLQPTSPPDGSPCFSTTPLGPNTPSPRASLITDSPLPKTLEADVERFRMQLDTDDESTEISSISSSPRLDKSSLNSTPPSCVPFDKTDDEADDDDDADDEADDDLCFPTYDNDPKYNLTRQSSYRSSSNYEYHPPAEEPIQPATTESSRDSTPSSPGAKQIVDDTAVQDEPSRQVDYLSHDWREEDIWCSWQHIVSNRRTYGERSRLENASWRTWAKSKYRLDTVSPESLNWMKDCDVTWLYGPLHESNFWSQRCQASNSLSKSNSFINKKPILKKRSVSEVMLQKSISNSSLVKQAAAAVQAQQIRRTGSAGEDQHLARTPSDFFTCSIDTASYPTAFTSTSSSGLQSPDNGRKHIRFDDTVEQCIAVDFERSLQDDETTSSTTESEVVLPVIEEVEDQDDDEDDDDDVIMLKTKSNRKPASTSSSRRSSVGQESKGIVKLPSTTLKYRDNEPDVTGQDEATFDSSYPGGRLQPSSSQETLRPSNPAANFLIDDDDEADMAWEPSGAFYKGNKSESDNSSSGMRRTPSGMFMPFEDGEEEGQGYGSTGMLGRVVDTVNTARDIMHVIMNVGWRS